MYLFIIVFHTFAKFYQYDEQEIEQEKAARSEVERMARLSSAASDHSPKKQRSTFENGGRSSRFYM